MMFRIYRTDFHIHTCLSPCGELEMTPSAIVRTCREKQINLIAICDHNSAENVRGVRKAAEDTDLTVLAGMEVTTAEEVHVLTLFDTEDQVLKLQEEVYEHLLPGENDEGLFGLQVVANELDEVEEISKKLLIGGTTIPLNTLVDSVHGLGGLAIASHIDRESFSLVGQLGMIPDGLDLDALEVSPQGDFEEIRSQIPGVDRFPLITSSDAHRLDEIGKVSFSLLLAEATMDEIKKGLNGVDGRRIVEGGISP